MKKKTMKNKQTNKQSGEKKTKHIKTLHHTVTKRKYSIHTLDHFFSGSFVAVWSVCWLVGWLICERKYESMEFIHSHWSLYLMPFDIFSSSLNDSPSNFLMCFGWMDGWMYG